MTGNQALKMPHVADPVLRGFIQVLIGQNKALKKKVRRNTREINKIEGFMDGEKKIKKVMFQGKTQHVPIVFLKDEEVPLLDVK